MGHYTYHTDTPSNRKTTKSEFAELLELLVAREQAIAELKEKEELLEMSKKAVKEAEKKVTQADMKIKQGFNKLSPDARKVLREMMVESDSEKTKSKGSIY